jgi:hypothetical protein
VAQGPEENLLDARSSFRGRRTRLAALATVAFVTSLVLPSQLLAAGPVKLDDGRVTPRSGSATTVFTFTVTYTSPAGVAPAVVRVLIDGSPHAMARVTPSDTNYRDGAAFRYSTTIRAGWHSYSFSGTDTKGRDGFSFGGILRVGTTTSGGGGASSGPTPTATPQTSSGGAGSGSTGPGSTGSAGSGGSGGSANSGGSGSSSGSSGGSGTGSGSTLFSSTTRGSTGAAAVGALAGSGTVQLVIVPSDALPVGAALGAATAGRAATRLAAGLGGPIGPAGGSRLDFLSPVPGYGTDAWTQAMAQTLAISTTTSVTVVFALMFFARRRQEERETHAQQAEARGESLLDAQALASYLYGPQKAAALAAELSLPRWRRPSLMAARQSTRDRAVQVIAAERLSFDRGTLAFGEGREFRKIRYRMVRLSDRPDEIQGVELGRLDEGDEVEVLERVAFYVKVRTPFGMEGWVHRTTVGAELSESDRASELNARTYNYVSPEDSLVTKLLRERSAV